MVIYNGLVFTDDCRFTMADILLEGDRIIKVAPAGSLSHSDGIDAAGGFVLPGFVDIHTHGAVDCDFCDAEAEKLEKMLEYYASNGITSVVPATMSFNKPILSEVIETAVSYFHQDGHGAVLRGVNMEGPFINIEKKGAQNGEYIRNPSLEMFNHLNDLSGGNIRLVDIAPEVEGSMEFIKNVSNKCVVSLAHTTANYDVASAAFDAGARHVTHLFNAMPPFDHREPGVIGAASDKAEFVELITDGIHLHPSVVRATFKWFGNDRVCLISDSMRACGMPNGEYTLGGQKVNMEDGKATLENGTIAGSATNLTECCRRAVGFGVSLEDAIRAASINPAKAVGLDNEVGSLTPGKRADVVIWNHAMQIQQVIIGGKTVRD